MSDKLFLFVFTVYFSSNISNLQEYSKVAVKVCDDPESLDVFFFSR
jgi:hypothetical protein